MPKANYAGFARQIYAPFPERGQVTINAGWQILTTVGISYSPGLRG